MKNKFISLFGSAVCCVWAGGAIALSCIAPEPATEDTPAAHQRAFLEYLSKMLNDEDPSKFLVYGQFQLESDKLWQHDVEHDARMKRREEGNWGLEEHIADIKYTYRSALSFSGYRVENGNMIPFETNSTILTIPVDGHFILGGVPPVRTDVAGLMWKDTATDYFHIDSNVCRGYFEISAEDFDLLVPCLKDGCGD